MFFDKPVYLTVSGQLAGEAAALGLRNIYTFGPTFRAENSNTGRHLAEFWMIEPEMAFCDLKGCIDVAEELIKHVGNYLLEHCKDELAFLDGWRKKEPSADVHVDVLTRLEHVVKEPFVRISYDTAFDLLREATMRDKDQFVYPLNEWGADLQKEHEDYLVRHFGGGVVVSNYPKDIKPFYMRGNKDGRTVDCMDVFLPGVGEVVGGSQREERYEELVASMEAKQMSKEALDWYVDTRRYGTVQHSGFGLGFERLVKFVTGLDNIRDTIPFPRTPGHAMC